MAGTLAHTFLPRKTERELGKAHAQARVLGLDPSFSVKYPRITSGLTSGLFSGAGVGVGAVLAEKYLGKNDAKFGKAAGGAVGLVLGMLLSGYIRSRAGRKMQNKIDASVSNGRYLDSDATRRLLKYRPEEGKASILAGLFLGQGPHQRGRLGEYKRLLEGVEDTGQNDLSSAPDFALWGANAAKQVAETVSPLHGLGVSAAVLPAAMALAGYDTYKGQKLEDDLITAQIRNLENRGLHDKVDMLGKAASSDTSPQGDNNIKTKVPEAKRVGGRKTQSKKVSVVDFDGSKAGLLANAAKCQKKA